MFSPFTANDPQLQVTIDRQRALALGVSLDEVTNALQVFLGSQYVNDFEFNNRAYRVYVQADQQFRASPQALKAAVRANAAKGTMIPLEQRRDDDGDDRAVGHRPFQPVPLGDDQRVARRRASARARRCRRWRSGDTHAAAGHELRVVGHLARGDQGGPAVVHHLRPGAAARLPDAWRAGPEPGAALHRPARRAARGAGRAVRSVDARPRQRRLLPGRAWSC